MTLFWPPRQYDNHTKMHGLHKMIDGKAYRTSPVPVMKKNGIR